MKRRDLLKGAAAGALTLAGGALAGCSLESRCEKTVGTAGGPAVLRHRRDLKLVTTWPKNLPGLGEAPERIAKAITEASEGELAVRVYAADELIPAFGAFDAVSAGNAEMYHGAEYYWQGKSQAYNFFTAVPFGLSAAENNAWIHHGGGQKLWDELAARFNIKAMPAGNTGVQMGGWFNRAIDTLEDFKGLRIRMPGLGGEVVRRLGAAAVALAGGDIFPNLQSGSIDATEWVGPWNDLALGFYQVARYYYYPGWHEPGSTLALGINLDVWNSLRPGQQTLIRNICIAEDNYNLAQFNHYNTEALRTLIEQHDVQLRRFPDAVMAEVGRISGEVLRESADADPFTRRVYESFLAARKNGASWAEVSDIAYWHARGTAHAFE